MLVKSLRQQNNWSQEHLAQLTGLNIRTVQRAEKGESVGLETLKALASVFEVDVNELKENYSKTQVESQELSDNELEQREERAKAEVQAKKEFYLLSLFLIGIFVFFLLPNYNQGENLGALIACAVSFGLIIAAHACVVYQPFGEKWEKRKMKQVMKSYEEE